MPADSAFSKPVPTPIVATAVLLLNHVPPDGELASVVDMPSHSCMGRPPLMDVGRQLTVIALVVVQPEPNEYVMVAVPGAGVQDIPVTRPVATSIVAIAGVLLAHVPPPVALASVIVCPTHTLLGPVIAPGNAFTVTSAVAEQPDTV